MATNGIKISALPAASAANATDQVEVNQGGTSRSMTLAQVLDVAGGAYLPLEGGTLTGPFGINIAGSGEAMFSYAVRIDGNHNELMLVSPDSTPNTLGVQNTESTSISAFIGRGSDNYEHFAVGWGNSGGDAPYANSAFFEASHWPYLQHTGTFNGTDIISGLSNTDGVVAGMYLSGTNITVGTTVLSFTATTITMSAAATGSGTNAFTINPIPPDQKFITSGWNTNANGYQATVWLTRTSDFKTRFYAGNNNLTTELGINGSWKFADGSISAPALSFLDDPDTGIYRHGAGAVGIGADGLASIIFTAAGSQQNYVIYHANNTPTFQAFSASGAADVALSFTTKGGAGLSFNTGGGEQFRVGHVSGATRYVLVGGSNGGDPLIGASGGSVGFISRLLTLATATGSSGFCLPHGTAPSSPVNGDMWTTTAGLFVRINGATVGPLT